MNTNDKAVGYIRVSTDKQADSGLSLESQEQKIRAMVGVLNDCELVGMEVDSAESAKNLNRPSVQRVLEMVKKRQVNVVVIWKLDRLTRSVRDLAYLVELFEKKGVRLVSVHDSLDTSTPAGRLVLNIMVSVAQWEREETVDRTKVVMRLKRAKGERAGFVPYGFRAELTEKVNHKGHPISDLVPEPAEQAIIERIKAQRVVGTPLREIAKELNERGLRTRAGGQWRFQYVANVLKEKK